MNMIKATHKLYYSKPCFHLICCFHICDLLLPTGELLRLMGADGVAVIVSRWFGGTLLGPDRFKFISNAARRLLEEHGVGHAHAHASGCGGGKQQQRQHNHQHHSGGGAGSTKTGKVS